MNTEPPIGRVDVSPRKFSFECSFYGNRPDRNQSSATARKHMPTTTAGRDLPASLVPKALS